MILQTYQPPRDQLRKAQERDNQRPSEPQQWPIVPCGTVQTATSGEARDVLGERA